MALILTRKKDQSIMIGDDVEVTVVDIRGEKVRLGITAPASIPVHRKEVYDAIKKENRAASGVKPEDMEGVEGDAGHGVGKAPKSSARPSSRESSGNHKDRRKSKGGDSDGSQSPSA